MQDITLGGDTIITILGGDRHGDTLITDRAGITDGARVGVRLHFLRITDRTEIFITENVSIRHLTIIREDIQAVTHMEAAQGVIRI